MFLLLSTLTVKWRKKMQNMKFDNFKSLSNLFLWLSHTKSGHVLSGNLDSPFMVKMRYQVGFLKSNRTFVISHVCARLGLHRKSIHHSSLTPCVVYLSDKEIHKFSHVRHHGLQMQMWITQRIPFFEVQLSFYLNSLSCIVSWQFAVSAYQNPLQIRKSYPMDYVTESLSLLWFELDSWSI